MTHLSKNKSLCLCRLFGVDILLPTSDCLEKFLGVRIVCEVVTDWLEKVVDCASDSWFQISRMAFAANEVGFELCIGGVSL